MSSASNRYELLPTSGQGAEDQISMGAEEQRLKPEEREGDRAAQYIALVTLITTWYIILNSPPGQLGWFAFHPPLQTLAVFLFTYGILTLQPTAQPQSKAAGFKRHQATILYVAVPAVIFGTLAVMYNKVLKGSGHFKTWHGTLGIVCMFWLLFQVVLGGGSVWFNGAAFGGGARAKAVWKYHRLSGYLLFSFMLLTVNLGGAWSHWGQRNFSYTTRMLIYVVSPASILTAVYGRVR
ncbi:hypothetical protein L218DRAFT_868192 [Marasmius fiardii PR-910]|nr:hypothetical protein L218DRAFT_868192 [Marasmius fiardii PR-910]